METKQIVGGVVGLAVAVILVATLLVPIVNSSAESTTDVTYTNEAIWRMDKILPTDEGSMTFDYGDDGTIAITDYKGNSYTVPLEYNTTFLASDVGYYRTAVNSTATASIVRASANGATGVESAGPSEIANRHTTISWSEGKWNMSWTGESVDYSYTSIEYTELYVPTMDGAYAMHSGEAYLTQGDKIFGTGYTYVPAASYITAKIIVSSDMTNTEVNVLYMNSTLGTPTVSNVATNYSTVGTNGYLFESITFDLSYEGYSTANATYNKVVVPYEVTIKELTLNKTTVNLLQVIPVLVLVGLVVGAVGMFIRTRAD